MSEQGSQYVGHDPAVTEIARLAGCIDPDSSLERSIIGRDGDGAWRRALVQCLNAGYRERLFPSEPERLRILTIEVLQGQYAHTDEIRAVDAFVGLGENGTRAE